MQLSWRLYLFVLQTLSLVVEVVPGVEDSQDESASPTLHLAVVGEQVLLQNIALHFGVAAVGVTRHTELHVVSDQVASRRRQVCSLTHSFLIYVHFSQFSDYLLEASTKASEKFYFKSSQVNTEEKKLRLEYFKNSF